MAKAVKHLVWGEPTTNAPPAEQTDAAIMTKLDTVLAAFLTANSITDAYEVEHMTERDGITNRRMHYWTVTYTV